MDGDSRQYPRIGWRWLSIAAHIRILVTTRGANRQGFPRIERQLLPIRPSRTGPVYFTKAGE